MLSLRSCKVGHLSDDNNELILAISNRLVQYKASCSMLNHFKFINLILVVILFGYVTVIYTDVS